MRRGVCRLAVYLSVDAYLDSYLRHSDFDGPV